MKITIDSNDLTCKVGSKTYGKDMPKEKEKDITDTLRKFLIENTKLSDYEEDCMWMSYRYCIGRHTIASHMHANDIWKNCKGRMSKERELFTAYDINREIEDCLLHGYNFPNFHFPLTSLNRIYTPAVDIVCQFIEENDIKSEADLCKYKDVYIKLNDDAKGYTYDVETWEEYQRTKVHELLSKWFENDAMSVDYAWDYFNKWKKEKFGIGKGIEIEFEKIINEAPNPENCYMHDLEDLFVWNDLLHCFDYEHHHKSILTDGTECEWFWSWTNKADKHDDGLYYRTFGYDRIRVPVNKWNGSITTWIPDESIKEDIY